MENATKEKQRQKEKVQGIKDWIKDSEFLQESDDDFYPSGTGSYRISIGGWEISDKSGFRSAHVRGGMDEID